MNLPIGDGAIDLCGAIDRNHFDAQLGVVDDDLYRVTFTTSDLTVAGHTITASYGNSDRPMLAVERDVPPRDTMP